MHRPTYICVCMCCLFGKALMHRRTENTMRQGKIKVTACQFIKSTCQNPLGKNRNAAGQETDGGEKKEKREGKRGKGMKREKQIDRQVTTMFSPSLFCKHSLLCSCDVFLPTWGSHIYTGLEDSTFLPKKQNFGEMGFQFYIQQRWFYSLYSISIEKS